MLKSTRLLRNLIWTPIKTSVRYEYPGNFTQLLNNLPPSQCSKLENGLTIITEEREVCNACIGIFIDGGARYEADFENGITHFFEHIAFKGTLTRSKMELENQMTCIGAQFNCFTTREIVGYYVQCLSKDVNLCVDILTDCVFNNCYSETDIQQQKKVVYKEMLDHDEDPNAMLDDFIHQTAFQGTSLAQTVMGRSSNLHGFNANNMKNYMNKYFNANRTVLAGCGGVKHDQLVCLARSYLNKLEPSKCYDQNIYRYSGSEIKYRNDAIPTAYAIVAVEAPCFCDADSLVLRVASEVIGGWDRTQPGDNEGFCEAFKPIYYIYKDAGLWGMKYSGNQFQLPDIWDGISKQWMNLCNMVTAGEVQRAKRFLKVKTLSRNESTTKTCIDLGKWALYFGYKPHLSEMISAIDHVTVEEIRKVAFKFIYDRDPVVASFGPTEAQYDHIRVKSSLYWLRL